MMEKNYNNSRTVQYSKKSADYVQNNNQLISLYKDFTLKTIFTIGVSVSV